MNKTQRIIKYVTVTFTIILVIALASLMTFGVISLVKVFKSDNVSSKLRQIEVNGNINRLEIEVGGVNLLFEIGDYFKVETNNKYIKANQYENKLSIEEKKHILFNKGESKLVITIPSDYTFDFVDIESGAGLVDITGLTTDVLSLDLGAGKVLLSNLNVLMRTEIDGGAGEIIIKDSNINNLDLDMGVGSLNMDATLVGKNSISAGVGEIDLNLRGNLEDYKIRIDKALGNVLMNGEKIINNTFYGNGNNSVEIDGGVGNITVKLDKLRELTKSYIRTYTVLNVTNGQAENEYYVTLQHFQGEVATVLINTTELLEVNKTYEFHFSRKSNDRIEDNILSIFDNSIITNIVETENEGMNQVQSSIN